MPEALLPRVSNVCAEATAERNEPKRHATTTTANDLPIPVSLAYAAGPTVHAIGLLERD
jgi:hypothetical protein